MLLRSEVMAMNKMKSEKMVTMQIRVTPSQLRKLESLVSDGVYQNNSAAIRDAVRRLIVSNYKVLVKSHKI